MYVDGKAATFSFSIPFSKNQKYYQHQSSILEDNDNVGSSREEEQMMMRIKNKNDNNNNKNVNRILLVDDELDITLSFSMVLEDNGFVVDAFNNPILALSSFEQGLYALALIDFRMPNMNGFELYNELRKIDDRVKVCFITAFDIQKEDLKAAIPELNAEKAVIIKKPIKMDDLAKTVAKKVEEEE
jgi:two-component system, OmpR family, response regulator ChvI